MKTLIKKDIKIVGVLTNFLLIFIGFIFPILIILMGDHFIRILLSGIIVFLMVSAALSKMWAHDFSKKTDIFLNSLPLDKEVIVASRYASILIYILSSSLFVFINSHVYRRGIFIYGDIYPIHVNEIINIISMSIFIMACYLPVYYRKGKESLNSSNMPLFMVILMTLILKSSDKALNVIYGVVNKIDLSQVSFVLIILSIIAYIVSLNISIKLYKSQEF